MAAPNTARPCRIEVRRTHAGRNHYVSAWEPVPVCDGTPRRYRSVREAKRRITDVYHSVDRLSRSIYDVRIVDAKTGEVIPISSAREDWAIREAFREQEHNSIGACLRRGEAVFV